MRDSDEAAAFDEITISIAKNGEPTVSVTGAVGEGCKALTASIEAAFGGEVISDTPTAEMFEERGRAAREQRVTR